MGGKPQKPKIQAYVDRQWFDAFEVYCSSHNLNQSKALEKILAEFFGGPSKQALPSDRLETAIAPALVDALRAELAELKQELEQRLQLVESRLGLESAPESAVALNGKPSESASELITSVDAKPSESAISRTESAQSWVTEAVTESATALDESAITASRLAGESVAESANLDTTTALEEVAKSAANLAIKSAIEIEEAIALNTLEDNFETATPSGGSVEVSQSATNNTPISYDAARLGAIAPSHEKGMDNDDILLGSVELPLSPLESPFEEVELGPLTSLRLAARLGVDNSNISRNKDKGNEYFGKWSAGRDPDGIAWEYRPGKNRSPQYHPLT
jgi:hypothetical protein